MIDVASREEAAERHHLAGVLETLRSAEGRMERSIDESAADIQASKELIWENQREMDHAEKANIRSTVDVSVGIAEHAVEALRRIKRLITSPYFGRVDFHFAGEDSSKPHYVGLHGFRAPGSLDVMIHDWRAPVSSLYYDFEAGEASFEAPEGTMRGDITGKRQYKIDDGRLVYMLESTLHIGDDILKQELSRSADDKMKHIVATIQREQNAVIRNETADVLILQGVAGSGKTSIALHRVAFLLYRFKDTLSSDNVMILSPNKVFGDYISNVLPELGEEQVAEVDFDAIAHRFLAGVTDFETFGEQVTTLLHGVDAEAATRMKYKATQEFVTRLDEWIAARSREQFTPAPIAQRGEVLSAEWVAECFNAAGAQPVFTRLERVADSAVYRLRQAVASRHKWTPADTTSVRRQVRAMFPDRDAFAMYRAFYDDPDRRGLFVPLGRKKIEYSDVSPLIYTMIKTSRQEAIFDRIRHLLVDEMQDYTPVQYAVLRALFSCKMTILGDSNQSANPFSSSSLETIRSAFPQADCLELTKSYRSTTEITEFAQNISRNDKLTLVDRHGMPPQMVPCGDEDAEAARVLTLVEAFHASDHRSLGIICKTVAQAETLYHSLSDAGVDLTFLDYGSTEFSRGVVITSAHISKGLEFDAVIVPGVSRGNYANEMDKRMLYIACTRAMHELHLTHHGEVSSFLDFASSPVRR